MKRPITVACLLIALGVAVVLLAKRGSSVARPLPPRDASLLVLSLTNLPKGSFAMLCLSNSTAAHIACVPEAVEESSAGEWTRTPLSGPAGRAVREWIGVPEELQPGRAAQFLVPLPTNSGAWRIVFMCQEQRPLTDPITNVLRHLSDTNAARVQSRQFSGRRYSITSPEILR